MENSLIWLVIGFIFSAWVAGTSPIVLGTIAGLIYTEGFKNTFNAFPLEYLGIHLHGNWWNLNLLVFPAIFYIIGSKLKKNREMKIQQEKEEGTVSSNNCPLEILSFSSRNNLFTAGNNSITFKVRNPSDMPYLFGIELWVGDKWKESGYREFEIGPKEIKEFNILGPAWRKASDIQISYCR
jgi:hypothetical protein